MKAKLFFINFLSVLAITAFISLPNANAQKNDQSSVKKQAITYCDDHIAATKTVLEKKANTTCNTARATIPCNDKKTGLPVHVTLVIQPDKKGCPNSVKVVSKVTDEPQSRGAARSDFSVEVIQEHCTNGKGVTLTAYIPGFDASVKKKIYDFEWMTEGEVFDTDSQAECIEGDKITLKVTNIATERMVIKSITIEPDAPSGGKDYKMFGFEKTACFGTCPAFKVAISKSGKATWNGISNIERAGTWEATIDASKMKEIKEAAFRANFFELSRKYPIEGEVADASKTITYFRTGDTEKTVTHILGGPDELVKYEEFLEKTINSLKWKRVADRSSK